MTIKIRKTNESVIAKRKAFWDYMLKSSLMTYCEAERDEEMLAYYDNMPNSFELYMEPFQQEITYCENKLDMLAKIPVGQMRGEYNYTPHIVRSINYDGEIYYRHIGKRRPRR